jgi:hypothetical protein
MHFAISPGPFVLVIDADQGPFALDLVVAKIAFVHSAISIFDGSLPMAHALVKISFVKRSILVVRLPHA